MAGRSHTESPTDAAGHAGVNREADFLAHRGLVFTVAYDVTGTVTDAEDVVQETYLRWREVQGPVTNPRAYLARIAVRQALNAVRASARRREEYPGEWLPEPLPTGATAQAERFDPEIAALGADEVSTAMLVVLQQLSGPERAAFLLREVFGFGYEEVASALDASQPSVRQLVHRARGKVRRDVPRGAEAPGPAEHRAAVDRFLEAAATGRVQMLLDVLAPDVVLLSDGGGKASAARRPVYGPENVAALLMGLAAKYGPAAEPEYLELNGLPAVGFREDGVLTTVFQLNLREGQVHAVYAVRNPEKLLRLQ